MKVGNIVKWYTDTAHFSLVSGIVIDTYMNEGGPVATVFWFVTQNRQNIITTRLTIISEA